MNCLICPLLSFVFFTIFDKKISQYISKRIPKYRSLSDQHKKEWNSRSTSTVHAATVTLICIYVIIYEESLHKNLVLGYSRIAEANMEIAVGYLTADFIILAVQTDRWRQNWGYMLHHASAAFAYIMALGYGYLHYFGNFRLLAELSTPFVNLRWALSVTDSKAGPLYFYNGCIMTLTFFVSRILVMPYYYYMVFQVVDTDDYKRSLTGPLHVAWLSVCVTLDFLNIMWFWRMLGGVIRHLHHPDPTPSHLAVQSSVPNGSAASSKSD